MKSRVIIGVLLGVGVAGTLLFLWPFQSRTTSALPHWNVQPDLTNANLRGLCVVNEDVIWFSGTQGTVGRTTDGGRTWKVTTVAGAAALDFRDVEAFSAKTAYVLSAGDGDQSRIYKTTDGGQTWVLQFTNADPAGFYDALAFWDEEHGLALGDPIAGRFQILTTTDGGAHWRPIPAAGMPTTIANESAFAASGTCLITHGAHAAWFVTGGGASSRVFHSLDRGQTWTVYDTPVVAGRASAGIFAIAFQDSQRGMIVGGDYKQKDHTGPHAALTNDGGRTWTLTAQPLPFRSAVAWSHERWVAVGSSGSCISLDRGATWQEIDRESYNSFAFTPSGLGWGVGERGRVARLERKTP